MRRAVRSGCSIGVPHPEQASSGLFFFSGFMQRSSLMVDLAAARSMRVAIQGSGAPTFRLPRFIAVSSFAVSPSSFAIQLFRGSFAVSPSCAIQVRRLNDFRTATGRAGRGKPIHDYNE